MQDEGPSSAINRALSILEILAEHTEGLTNSQISLRLGIPKSSASYLLQTLEKRAYLRRENDTGKYHLTLKILGLSRNVLGAIEIREPALPLLRSLVEHSQLTAHLAVLEHGKAVYVEKVDAPGFIKMDTWVGRRMDIHCTAVGKSLVAFLPKEEVEAILHENGLNKRTPNTITSSAKFFQELEKVRVHGNSVDDEENNLGARCVAAPIFDALGRVEAAVGVSGTSTQISRSNMPKIAELVREAARQISIQLGYHPTRRATGSSR